METKSRTGNGKLSPQGKAALEAVVEAEVLRIPLQYIRAYCKQPREYFDPATMEEIAGSMREKGQTTPGSVRKLTPPEGEHRFELVDGERRFRACAMAGLLFFRAVVETDIRTEKEQFERSAIANFCREGCTPLETARMIQRFKSAEFQYTEEKIAKILGRSVGYVRAYYALLRLHPEVQKLMDPRIPEEKRLTLVIAQKMLRFRPEWQVRLANQISGEKLRMNAARHLIHQAYVQAGVLKGEKETGKEFQVMAGAIQRMRLQLEMDNELAEDYLRDLLANRDPEIKKGFLESLRATAAASAKFARTIERILK